MVNLFGFLVRRKDFAREEFSRHWREVHAPLVRRMETARRYVQYHAAGRPVAGFPAAPYDGVARLWFDDLAAIAALRTDESYTAHAAPDEPNFLDLSELRLAAGLAAPAGSNGADGDQAALFFLHRRSGLNVDALCDRLDVALAGAGPSGTRPLTGDRVALLPGPDGAPPCDVVAIIRGLDGGAWLADELEGIVDMEASSALAATEHRMIWP